YQLPSSFYALSLHDALPIYNLLLQRMLGNLIHNSIVHNPTGCIIGFSVGSHENNCIFIVSDNGHGMSEPQLNALNSNEDIFSSRSEEHTSELQSRFDLVCRL